MVVGEVAEGVDLLVVGAGPGGYTAALRAAQLGRQVTLVDRDGEDGVGGVCLRVGCIPSKALIEVADICHHARTGAERGIVAPEVGVDLGAFQDWKATRVAGLTGGVRGLLHAAGVRVVAGSFRFNRVGKGVVRTDGDVPPLWLEYTDVVLATGSRPTPLPGVPFDGAFVLDSTAVLELTTLPERVVVVGGGYIGLELGTALAKLGAAVTIIELQDRLLPEMDAGFSRPVAKRLSALGVEVRLGTAVTGAAGGVVTLREGSAESTLETDCVVVAIGRTSNTDELGLDRVGVDPGERGLLTVGADRLVAPHVAAIGDITPGPALAHKASAEAEVAVAALCGHAAAFQPATIPAVVFSDPEIATAGYTAAQARAEGVDVDVARFPLAASGRAATVGASEGFAQLVIDRGMDAVIGVHIAGPHASELIAEGVLAIEMAASPEDLASSIHPHPTFSELVSEVALVAVGRPVHIQASKRARS